jgi:predicted kinase
MAAAAILVNGLPGLGKSTLAIRLALLLGCPVLSTDAVRGSLKALTDQTVADATLDRIAVDTVWSLAAAIRDGVVVDSFWFSGRDDAAASAGVSAAGAESVVEVWCDAPVDPADEAIAPLVGAQPLGIWPVVRVDVSAAVDFDELLPELASHLLG